MDTYSLTKQQFMKLHEALFYLDNTRDQLAGLLHPDLIKQISTNIYDIRMALKHIYDREDVDVDSRFRYFQDVKICHGFRSEWSIYEAAVIHDRHPYTGARSLTYQERKLPIWGETWFDLWQAADGLIIESGDFRNIYVEKFEQDPSDPSNLNLVTGS